MERTNEKSQTPHFGGRNAPFIPNGSMGPSPVAGVPAGLAGLPPQSRIIEKNGARILCVADVRGLCVLPL